MALSGTEITRLGPGTLGTRPRRIFYSSGSSTYSMSIAFAGLASISVLRGGDIGESITIAGESGLTGILLSHEDYIAEGDFEFDAFQSILDLD